MASCNECIHGYVCDSYWQGEGHMPNLCTQEDLPGYICENFKDKSRYIELPCKVGDAVYIVDEYSNEFDEIDKCEITSFGYNGVFIYFKIDKDNFCYSAGHIGKTVFLSYEEAEKALKELKDD